MKKLLAVAAIGVVGYLVVKKLRNKNEEVEVNEVEENIDEVEEVEEAPVVDEEKEEKIVYLQDLGPDDYIVADNDEEVEVVDNVEVEEEKIFDKIKGFVMNLVKAPIKLVVKACGFICGILVNMNRKLENIAKEIDVVEYKPGVLNAVYFYIEMGLLMLGHYVILFNRAIILALGFICKGLNKLML